MPYTLPMSECPFCLANKTLEGVLLVRGEHCYVVSNKHPVLAQAVLVIPYRHAETLFEMSEAELLVVYVKPCDMTALETLFEMSEAELLEALTLTKRAKALLDEAQPDGYTIGWNVGAVGGQEVMHAHLHVIARFADEPLAGQGLRYHLKQPQNRRPGR